MSKRAAEAAEAAQRGSLRLRDHVKMAVLELQKQELEHREAVHVREQLLRRITILEQVLDQNSVVSVLQRVTQQALSVIKQPATVFHDGLEPSGNALDVQAFPDSILKVDDALMKRITSMNLGDHVLVYKSYLARAQPMALHAQCHGDNSSTYQALSCVTRQYSTYIMLHAVMCAPIFMNNMTRNFETGERDNVPQGWFKRVADILPPHAEFAQLVLAGMALLQNMDLDGLAQFRKQSDSLLRCSDGNKDILHLSHLLEDYSSGPGLRRQLLMTEVTAHLLMSLLAMPDFPQHVVSSMLCNCWPFVTSGEPILMHYLQRKDVQQALGSGPVAILVPAQPRPTPPADTQAPDATGVVEIMGHGAE